jgi:flagellar protein FliS
MRKAASKANVYLENKIKTASPLELIIIAYEGAIMFLETAKDMYRQKNYLSAGTSVVKAQKVIHELRNALDMDIEEISNDLFILYRFMDKQLLKAHRQHDVDIIDGVIKMLSGLKESWQAVAKTLPQAVPPDRRIDDAQFVSVYK